MSDILRNFASMKLKYEFYFQQLGKEYVGVPVGDNADEFSGMLQLDDVAYDIVSRLSHEITRDELINEMQEIYDADRDTLAYHIDNVIKYLKDEKVIDDH